ncbi:MAG: hypothetical protein FJ298_06705 [Planctomycetes bacterium]|nr:hypothetical protein [Planctomycetota bacterium]
MNVRPAASLLVCALAAGCASTPIWSSYRITEPLEVPAALELARGELAAGRSREAYERVRAAREVLGLSVEVRDELERLAEACATRRVEELVAALGDPDDFDDLEPKELPRQLAVEMSLAIARHHVDDGAPLKALKVLEDLETAFPRHHGRVEASALLIDAGVALVHSGGGWWLWTDRDDGVQVLEFVVLNYPGERRVDEAFFELANAYEHDEQWGLAIQRHEELVVSHVDSPLAPLSQARIPHLRLAWIESPEYDRKDLLRARAELEHWLSMHAGQSHEADVRLDLADCLERLVRSDLGIARFYQRIDQPFGARFHALRGREVARESGSSALVAVTEALLSELPDVSTLPGERRASEDAFAPDDDELRDALERARDAEARSQTQATERKP